MPNESITADTRSGALIAFFGSQYATANNRWSVAAFVIVFGIYGALFSAKQYERSKFHMLAAGLHGTEIEKTLSLDLSKIRSDAEEQQKKSQNSTY